MIIHTNILNTKIQSVMTKSRSEVIREWGWEEGNNLKGHSETSGVVGNDCYVWFWNGFMKWFQVFVKTHQVVHPLHMSLLWLIVPKYICYPKKERMDGWKEGTKEREREIKKKRNNQNGEKTSYTAVGWEYLCLLWNSISVTFILYPKAINGHIPYDPAIPCLGAYSIELQASILQVVLC